MSEPDVSEQDGHAARDGAGRFAFWVPVLVATSAAVALALAVTTPARSGPFCRTACMSYPYTAAAAFVPRDYLWMYPATVMALLFVALVACVSYFAPAHARLDGQVAFAFAVISATALVLDYAVQLTVMQPSLLAGETGDMSLFSQYNPHGVFIALENAGYFTMGVAFFFAASALDKGTRLLRAVSIVWALSAALAVGSLPLLAAFYGHDLNYRYEVAAIVIDYVALIVSGVVLFRAWCPAKAPRVTRPRPLS